MDRLPIVCTLTAGERLAQWEAGLPGLAARATECVELSTGYRFRFADEAGMLARIADAVALERQCCRFLRFQIAAEPDLGSITLDVSGHAATKAFLTELFVNGLPRP